MAAAQCSVIADVAVEVLRLLCHIVAHEFLVNYPYFDLEPDYIIRKQIDHRILPYIRRWEILSTFHTRVDNRSIRHFCIVFTPKLPLPLRRSPPKSRPHSPPQTASGSNQPCRHCSQSVDRQMAMTNVPYQCSAILIASDALICFKRSLVRTVNSKITDL